MEGFKSIDNSKGEEGKINFGNLFKIFFYLKYFN